MKILQVNVVYNIGSTGKIVYDIHTELKKQNIESVVCYGRGEAVRENDIHKICGESDSDFNHFWANLSGILYGGCLLSTNKLISTIKKEKPDIVHLHCLNGYFVNIYRLVTWLKKHNVKTVLTLHAEFMYTGGCSYSMDCEQWSDIQGCGHFKCPRYRSDMKVWFFDRSRTMWQRMKKAFKGFENGLVISSVSPWLMERALRSPILCEKKHCVILNGIDTGLFRTYDGESATKLKKELGIGNEKIIFHATACFSNDMNHIKGGYYIIELAKRMPECKFIIAGNSNDNINVPDNIILLGKITDTKRLAKLYSMADLTVITSKKETFSMIVAESLCCGTPIVGFKAGAPEMIAISEYSAFSEHGDLDLLERNVRLFLDKKCACISEKAACVYSRERMVDNYLNLYLSLSNEVIE